MIVIDDEAETKYYYHFDGLGSVVALSDVNSVIVERYSYDVFGEPNTIGSFGNPYLFTGRRHDSETALYYYRARYYDYYLGRFLQTDPIGYTAGLNLYTYCGNNPINLVDPSGEFLNFLIGGGVGAVVGGTIGGITAAVMGGDVKAGIIGGAVTGAMVGSGAAIIGAAVGAGTISAGGALGVSSLLGASSAVVGNTTSQVLENIGTGQSTGQAIGNVNTSEQIVAGSVGALTGLISGGIIVGNAGFQAQSRAMNEVLSRNINELSEALMRMGADQATILAVQGKIIGGMTNVGLTANQISMYSAAINTLGIPVIDNALN